MLNLRPAVLGVGEASKLARSPALKYLFFYRACKTVARSAGIKLLKGCGAFSMRASIQPAKALCSFNFNNLPTSILDDPHLTFDAELAHMQHVFDRLLLAFQPASREAE